MAHLSFFLAGFGLPGLVFVSSIFRDRMSRIKSKNTWNQGQNNIFRVRREKKKKDWPFQLMIVFYGFFPTISEVGPFGKKKKKIFLPYRRVPGFWPKSRCRALPIAGRGFELLPATLSSAHQGRIYFRPTGMRCFRHF
jgi:hypothetical protein